MFDRMPLSEAFRIAFRIARPVAIRGCCFVQGLACDGVALNGKSAFLTATSQYGVANVILDSSGCSVGLNRTFAAPFELNAVIFKMEPVFNGVSASNLAAPSRVWNVPEISIWSQGFRLSLSGTGRSRQ